MPRRLAVTLTTRRGCGGGERGGGGPPRAAVRPREVDEDQEVDAGTVLRRACTWVGPALVKAAVDLAAAPEAQAPRLWPAARENSESQKQNGLRTL